MPQNLHGRSLPCMCPSSCTCQIIFLARQALRNLFSLFSPHTLDRDNLQAHASQKAHGGFLKKKKKPTRARLSAAAAGGGVLRPPHARCDGCEKGGGGGRKTVRERRRRRGISSKSKSWTSSSTTSISEELATIASRGIQTSIRLVLPGKLVKDAVFHSRHKAVTRFNVPLGCLLLWPLVLAYWVLSVVSHFI